MTKITIIGCGIIGATIAYELSLVSDLEITVLDQQAPAQECTAAALGVLMGIIGQKAKGKSWKFRESSVKRYQTLIPELETITNQKIPVNYQGILQLALNNEDWEYWQNLVKIRKTQNWHLESWEIAQINDHLPQINTENVKGAIYSPHDIQINPTHLTLALVKAATERGVNFQFNTNVVKIYQDQSHQTQKFWQIETDQNTLKTDWLVVATGNGTTPLIANYDRQLEIGPVLGQAIHLRLAKSLGNPQFQPVITGNDVHIVPYITDMTASPIITDYWIGATLEFPTAEGQIIADPDQLALVKQQAIAFCPELVQGVLVHQWSGLRPRPIGKAAPIVGKIEGTDRLLIASGHYRNGVLLAPATAKAIGNLIFMQN